jgi:hypothetical protein
MDIFVVFIISKKRRSIKKCKIKWTKNGGHNNRIFPFVFINHYSWRRAILSSNEDISRKNSTICDCHHRRGETRKIKMGKNKRGKNEKSKVEKKSKKNNIYYNLLFEPEISSFKKILKLFYHTCHYRKKLFCID